MKTWDAKPLPNPYYGMAEGLPKVKEKVMTMKYLSEKFSLITVLFFVFSLFLSTNSFSMPQTDFLDNCPTGQSMNGCCLSQSAINSSCTFGNGATKVNVCHNNGTIEPSTNSIAGNTPGAHFLRCDWVAPGSGQDATNTTCDVACLVNDGAGPGINSECSSPFQNSETGHSEDVLGECAPGGCVVNGCDDGNPCTEDVCNQNTEECEFPTVVGQVECRASTGDCDPAELCGTGTNAGDMCPTDMFANIGMTCDDSIIPSTRSCEAEVCDDMGECMIDSSACNCEFNEDCDDGNSCTNDLCVGGTCMSEPETDGTICRSASGICDEAEMCDGSGAACPGDDFVPAEDMVVCDDDGDDCTEHYCDGIGNCELIMLEPPDFPECGAGGDGDDDDDDDTPPPSGDPDEEDDILETDNGEAFQLYCFYDLRDRDSFCQITNVGDDFITLHVQVFNVADNCNENDFNDTYTPKDTHVYELSNILTNDGDPSGIDLPDNAYGFVVVTVVNGEGGDAIEGDLIGNFRVLDGSGYEYRSNAQGLDLPSGDPIETTNEYTFNFNQEGGVVLSDVVGITLDEIDSNEVKATSIVDIFAKFDISVFNNDEVIFSCRDIVFACNDQDAPNLNGLLNVSNSNVASFEYGINDAIPHTKGGPLLCPSNNVTEGFVRLNLIPPFGDFDVFTGYVGLNNGNGRGSMDSFWSENFLLVPEP